MKTIIIEGLDRCGKDTIIDFISKQFDDKVVIHFVGPQGDTPEERRVFQEMTFRKNLFFMKNCRESGVLSSGAFLMNRSHLGEYVYGPMYRNTDASWVLGLEKEYFNLKDTYLITMYADPEFIVKKDDGKSFSVDIEKKKEEVRLFKEVHKKSKIKHKLLLKVNDGDKYIDLKEEKETIKKFLEI